MTIDINGKKKILVAGDAMLDIYHFGDVNRISPEAPVPVFLETGKCRYVPGGAANVSVNIAAIGIPISFFSAVGNDDNGKTTIRILKENNVDTGLITDISYRKTTSKLRYIGPGNQQLLRVDEEDTDDIPINEFEDTLNRIVQKINEYGVFVLSDYKKGFLTQEMTERLISIANEHNIPVIVDVKDMNYRKYTNATIIKPNRKELGLLSGMAVDTNEDAVKAAVYLCNATKSKYVLATLGSDGMILTDNNGLIEKVKSTCREVYDVTGAGDTSIAYLAAEIIKGTDIKEAMKTANYAAGVQVSKVGTSIVYPEEVYEAIRDDDDSIRFKCLDYYKPSGLSAIESVRKRGKRIVFTNGCFDILHIGHIYYLREAKKLGDILVVGVNSDPSVKRLKGSDRPVNTLKDRLEMLAALDFVDYVIPFDEDTPEDLIRLISPDVLVKGGDYSIENIVGADHVMGYGGTVKVIPFVEGHSTSSIIEKIQKG